MIESLTRNEKRPHPNKKKSNKKKKKKKILTYRGSCAIIILSKGKKNENKPRQEDE